MSTVQESLKEILVFSYQVGNDLYFNKRLMAKHEWDHNLNNDFFAVLNNENAKSKIIEFIEARIKDVGEELEKINETYSHLSVFQDLMIRKNKYNLLFLSKERLKKVKKFIVRKRYLEKKIKRLERINSNSNIIIINEDDYDENYKVFNKGQEIDKEKELGTYYVSKVVNSDNEFKIFFLIEEKDIVPKKVVSVKDNVVHVVFAINKHSGSEEYTDLIDVNKVMPDGSVIGTKFVAFKEKQGLIDFLGKINKGLNESYFSAIRSLK